MKFVTQGGSTHTIMCTKKLKLDNFSLGIYLLHNLNLEEISVILLIIWFCYQKFLSPLLSLFL